MSRLKDEDERAAGLWTVRYLNEKWKERGIPPSAYCRLTDWINRGETPIERRLLTGLLFCPFGFYDELNEVVSVDELTPERLAQASSALIVPQAQIAELAWRVDFVVFLSTYDKDVRPPRLVIECDGHDFHERTKEQAARDRKRDRDLQALGVPILRFTGSEIFRDVDGCIDQIDGFGAKMLEDAWKKAGII